MRSLVTLMPLTVNDIRKNPFAKYLLFFCFVCSMQSWCFLKKFLSGMSCKILTSRILAYF